jgi:eukaryotic-like serine/threonine-protein kinase
MFVGGAKGTRLAVRLKVGMSSSRPSDPGVHTIMTLEPGTRLDRYELLCVLAHGGMANIWLGRVQGKVAGFEKLYAIKTILPNVAHDQTFKDMFLDEARIASRISHPNVVHMVDVGEFSGLPFLVMDLVEGEPLYKLPRACEKRGVKMPLGVVLRILADACHGLHAAHELSHMGTPLNVVHRDVSPQNILVSTAGQSKVIDFGVAKARDRSAAETSAGTLKGKISYMPTEQARGHEVDRRADTWALGAVLYWLLCGRPPYKEENQLATLQLAVTAAPIPPLPDSVPFALRMIVKQALEHDPADRFQTAAELGEALEGAMQRLGVASTHAEVAAFLERVLGDRIAARRRQISAAIAEADSRKRPRKDSAAIPIDLDDASGSELIDRNNGVVDLDLPNAIASVLASAPPAPPPPPLFMHEVEPREQSSTTTLSHPDATSVGTFVATQHGPAIRKRWPLVVIGALLSLMGLAGIVLIALTLKRGLHEVAPLPDPPPANAASAMKPPSVPEPTPPTTATTATAAVATATATPVALTPPPAPSPKPANNTSSTAKTATPPPAAPPPPPPPPPKPPATRRPKQDDNPGF